VRRVSFVGNPVVKLAGYRLFVIAHLPKLRELDGTYVGGVGRPYGAGSC